MRLLFDQNISFRIIRLIEPYFPESQQVRALMLENVTDFSIWNYAKLKNFTELLSMQIFMNSPLYMVIPQKSFG